VFTLTKPAGTLYTEGVPPYFGRQAAAPSDWIPAADPKGFCVKQFLNLILFAGLEKDQFNLLEEEIREENRNNLRVCSMICAVLFGGLFVLGLFFRGLLENNLVLYCEAAGVSLIVFLFTRHILPRFPGAVKPVLYLYFFLMIAFCMIISLRRPEYPAVTVIAVLLLIPFLVTDRPACLIGSLALCVLAFCILAWVKKAREVALIDISNALIFGSASMVCALFLMHRRYRFRLMSHQLKYYSETDLLTGACNRNSYERRLHRYEANCYESVTCIYVDVNGLHALNDSQGHAAGDEMLRQVAHVLMEQFGKDFTFRIGGDEFVVFRMDVPQETTEADMKEVNRKLEELGYHISSGIAVEKKDQLVINELVVLAESRMYMDKKAYYQITGIDRRKA